MGPANLSEVRNTQIFSDMGEAIDYQPPSASIIDNLDNILKGQFGEIEDVDGVDAMKHEESQPLTVAASLAPPRGIDAGIPPEDRRVSGHLQNELGQQQSTLASALVENKAFTAFFMTLTFYALFVPDLDLLLGNKTSELTFSITTSFVLLFFIVELVIQSLGRKKYFGRAYFWLDVVALISLIPDTWIFKWLISLSTTSNAFVAGRSSRLTKLIRIASRSSKATRLNRLTRIVRVASLMPRLGAFLGHRIKGDDTEKLLEKKLRRVFTFLDEDMDGQIPRIAIISCMAKMREEETKTDGPNIFSKIGGVGKGAMARMGAMAKSPLTKQGQQDEGYNSEGSQVLQASAPNPAIRSAQVAPELPASTPSNTSLQCEPTKSGSVGDVTHDKSTANQHRWNS